MTRRTVRRVALVAAVVAGACLLASANAAATTITFAGLTGPMTLDGATTYTEGGYDVDWTGGGQFPLIADDGSGNYALWDSVTGGGTGTGARIRRTDRESFTLDAIQARNFGTGLSYYVILYAYLEGTKVYDSEFFSPDVSPTYVDLTPTFIGQEIDDLRITIVSNTASFAVDNIEVNAYVIPEPVTMAGLALGGTCLAGYVRRRRAR